MFCGDSVLAHRTVREKANGQKTRSARERMGQCFATPSQKVIRIVVVPGSQAIIVGGAHVKVTVEIRLGNCGPK